MILDYRKYLNSYALFGEAGIYRMKTFIPIYSSNHIFYLDKAEVLIYLIRAV